MTHLFVHSGLNAAVPVISSSLLRSVTGRRPHFTGKFDSLKSWNFRSNAYKSLVKTALWERNTMKAKMQPRQRPSKLLRKVRSKLISTRTQKVFYSGHLVGLLLANVSKSVIKVRIQQSKENQAVGAVKVYHRKKRKQE